MEITPHQHRQAFVGWLRTGHWRLPPTGDPDVKFNHNHDPANGRFTSGGGSFGGGGASSGFGKPSARVRASNQPSSAVVGILPSPRASRSNHHAGDRAPRAAIDTKPTVLQTLNRSVPTKPRVVVAPDPKVRREVRNDYTYVIDDQNRTREVSGQLHTVSEPARSRAAQRSAGGIDRRPTDHGGHYIAARFDGPTDAFNHFSQNGNFNTGTYRAMEDKWAKALKLRKEVIVTITPFYVGHSKRPSDLLVLYKIDGHLERQPFRNERQGKSA